MLHRCRDHLESRHYLQMRPAYRPDTAGFKNGVRVVAADFCKLCGKEITEHEVVEIPTELLELIQAA